MIYKKYLLLLCSTFVFVGFVIGCKPPNPDGRLAITGTVAVNGTPIQEGAIAFEPSGSPAVKTPSGAAIINGKYSIPADKGLVAGEYTVRIHGSRNTGKVDESDPMKPVIYEQLVPEKYNTFSKEKVTVDAGATKFDFDLQVEESDFKKK